MPDTDLPLTAVSGIAPETVKRDSLASLWHNSLPDGGHVVSEAACLELVDSFFPSRSEHAPRGRGDDCAELTAVPGGVVLSTDMFWEDIHFRTGYFTPQEAGGKALAAAVSDLAAAGAVPLGFSLALMLPSWLGRSALGDVLSGMAEKAHEYGIFLTGGDLSRGEKLGFSISVWGERVHPQAPFFHRGTARPGDCLFLVGEAGLARVGLWALENHGRAALGPWPEACAAHLAPRPLLAVGQAIARLAHMREPDGEEHRLSLMDLSDGLARDVPRLLGGLGVDLTFDKQSIHAEVVAAAEAMGREPEELFLLGGEDYALIGTCAEPFWPLLSEAVPGARPLGRVGSRPGLFRHGRLVSLKGFDHFSGHEAVLRTTPPDIALTAGSALPAAEIVPEARPAGPPEHPGGPLPGGRVLEAAGSIIAICREAWTGGLMAGFNGNVSCRVIPDGRPDGWPDGRPGGCPDGGPEPDSPALLQATAERPGREEVCLITRSGAAKARLTEQDFALLSLQGGNRLAGAPASTESAVHLAIYAACPQSRVIMHTHPPCLLALSLLLPPEERLVLPLPEAEAYRARLGQTPFRPPGSPELADVTAEKARRHPAVWMERHGLVVHARDFSAALSLTEELEQLAKVHLGLLHGRGQRGGRNTG